MISKLPKCSFCGDPIGNGGVFTTPNTYWCSCRCFAHDLLKDNMEFEQIEIELEKISKKQGLNEDKVVPDEQELEKN